MSVVYFIQAGAGGCIKIGIASNLQSRISCLQIGCPDMLVLLASVPGGAKEESFLHEHLRRHRVRGEWFKPAPEVLDAVESAKQGRFPEPRSYAPSPLGEFSHLRNIVGWIRARVAMRGWSPVRLAVEAGLDRNTLLGCESDDWNPTYSTLLACELTLLGISKRDAA
jgi:hypothetical protein